MWYPIESAPLDRAIWVWDEGLKEPIIAWWAADDSGEYWWANDGFREVGPITHWTPISELTDKPTAP
jgi:hypothetical protein